MTAARQPRRCGRRTVLLGGLGMAAGLAAGGGSAVRSAMGAMASIDTGDGRAGQQEQRSHRLLPAGYLRTQGASIVDGGGTAVRLAGVNWYGFETPAMVVGGLDHQTVDGICARILELGFNMVRLPFSLEMARSEDGVTEHLDREPALRGLPPLEIMDRVIVAAGRHGLKVVLDSHRSDAAWSLQSNGLWYTPEYTEAVWIETWVRLVERYRDMPTVVGCDLRNEPGDPPQDATAPPGLGGARWGAGGDGRDWAAAAERAGNAILDHNGNLLICVEGVRDDPAGPWLDGARQGYWPGGNLSGVRRAGGDRRAARPIRLSRPDRLVYSAHDYGSDMSPHQPWTQLGSTASNARACRSVWDQTWGYLVRENIAPVWIGEFGTPNGQRTGDTTPAEEFTDVNDHTPQGAWFTYLVDYIRDLGLSWSIWALNGTQSAGSGRSPADPEWYGVLDPTWTRPASPSMMAHLRTIQATDPDLRAGQRAGVR
ncbi:MAG: endoglucanase [Chloroflexota bacterium]|nr:endoglucanase [Chloroflexota bacterium]